MTEATVPARRRLRRRLWWLLVVAVMALATRLPLSLARKLGRDLARIALRVRPVERRQAQANLAAALPELDALRRRRLLEESTRRLGENLADTLAVPRLLERAGLVTEESCPGTDHLPLIEVLARLAARGNGVILLMGHIGCWELLGAWLAAAMKERGLGALGAVTGTVHNPAVDRLLQQRRRSLGLEVLPRTEGATPLLRHLRRGGVVAALIDQNTSVASRPVDFFGRPAPTPTGPVRLARRYGIPLLPVAIGRYGEGHRVVHLPPLEPGAGTELSMLEAANTAVEEFIRRNPAEWVWFHRRWEQRD